MSLPTENNNILQQFHPIVQTWFEQSFESPTPPQLRGWPPIFRGDHTLILSPTGSGKTLAAFLVCINNLIETLLTDELKSGVHTLYISPLKALNYDIERNLEAPLSGIQLQAETSGLNLPAISRAVRTGDTPQKEREKAIKNPPHIFITTPESLHLMLTSTRQREILKTVKYVIVDEIHALSDNKRGTFLSILLERLQYIAEAKFQRIGLSATQNPLEEIAQFLGGYDLVMKNKKAEYTPRPVTIVDAGMRKNMDLGIVSPVDDFKNLPEDTIWPDIYGKLLNLIQDHRSTLIFTNNRAAAERITAEINERAGYELVFAHHGSVSKSVRMEIEQKLKNGEIPALAATSTLELGIDMGAIDLVCQVESPKSVARGLQRVGRAGHLFKSTSVGRFLPKTRADLLDLAVLTQAMKQGAISPIRIPRNCLDILAQQIIAMVAMTSWKVTDIFDLIRCAYPYQELPYESLLNVLEMVSGQYPSETFKDLKPRISWDRVNQVLYALPGTQRNAIFGGGAIPDTGQFGCYLEDGITKIGELEEEFVYERRLGEVFLLGTSSWRIREITHDRVIVAPAPGESARMPFWKGEFFYRSSHLGELFGIFSREVKRRLKNENACLKWLKTNADLDEMSARNLYQYFSDQNDQVGVIPDDKTVLIESFRDDMGDMRLAILTPFGGKLHLPWLLAITNQFRKKLSLQPEALHSDAGILFRFTTEDVDKMIKIILSVSSDNLEESLIEELGNSFFFGMRFRQNANRAMLIPRPKPGKRAPLWLQRMRARDLLEITRQYPSFPIVMETYRESLQDYFAVDALKNFLSHVESGEIHIQFRTTSQPSPFTSSLLFEFMAAYMYEYDDPKLQAPDSESLDREQLQQLLHPGTTEQLLKNESIAEVDNRLQSRADGYKARTATELVELLRRVGDLTEDEIAERITGVVNEFLAELSRDVRIIGVRLQGADQPERWIIPEEFPIYRYAFPGSGDEQPFDHIVLNINGRFETQPAAVHLPNDLLTTKLDQAEAGRLILLRYIRHRAIVTEADLLNRYPLYIDDLKNILEELHSHQEITKIMYGDVLHWGHPDNIQYIRKVTLRQQRKEAKPCDTAQFTKFLLRWQHRTQENRLEDSDGLIHLLKQFQGASFPAEIWENEIFGRRLKDYSTKLLDELCRKGEIIWYGTPSGGGEFGNIIFTFRNSLSHFHSLHQKKNNHQHEIENSEIIRKSLEKHGACFLSDIASATDLSPSTCLPALWEMVWTGDVTNDSFSAVRSGKPVLLKNESQVLSPSGRQRFKTRMNRAYSHYSQERWSLVPQPACSAEDSLEIVALQIMQRYGLICRELYDLEGWPDSWYHIYNLLTRLEWRGEVRRGYFVRGLSGLQFALPKAVHMLKELSAEKEKEDNTGKMILINSCDPANLYGAASPLPLLHPLRRDWRFLRHPKNYLILKDGYPLMAVEAGGKRLTPLRDLSIEDIEKAFTLLPRLLDDPANWRQIKSIKVETWNGEPVRNSSVATALKSMGFRDDFKEMILERSF